MATKQTSGGVTYDPVTGGPLDEPSALNLDARLREVGARITYAAAESEARDDTLAARIDSELTRLTTSHVAYDDDGVPAIVTGSRTARILTDTDGTPAVVPA